MQPDAANINSHASSDSTRILYKYRSINKWTEELIANKSIWLAKPETLNDPLECQIKLIPPQEMRKHVREVKNAQVSGFMMGVFMAQDSGTSFYGRTKKQLKYLLKKIKAADGFNKKYEIICDFHREVGVPGFSCPEGYFNSLSNLLNEVGVFSLSENPVSTLMWSHYGECHRGIALGFSAVPGSDLADNENCRKVIYSDELSEFSFENGFSASTAFYHNSRPKSNISFDDTQVQRIVFTKTNDWAYEMEWRYVKKNAGPYDLPAPITEVIFGAKCPVETREKYRVLISSSLGEKIKFREAVFLPGTTTIKIKDC